MGIQKITSFTIDHTILNPGFYISRVDGDITTYDLRTRKPNTDDVMSVGAMHTMEHMFATFVRNSDMAQDVIYFGPMGCQTGFYLLVRNRAPEQVLETTMQVLRQVIAYQGEVFGNSAVECGNYRTLDLSLAQEECRRYLAVLEQRTARDFTYPTKGAQA